MQYYVKYGILIYKLQVQYFQERGSLIMRLRKQPVLAIIEGIEFPQKNSFVVIVTFCISEGSYMRGSTSIRKQFLLYEPQQACAFAQLMKFCNESTNFSNMLNQKVQLIVEDTSLDFADVVAICHEKLDCIYPLHSYGKFSMKTYTYHQFWTEWNSFYH